MSEEHAIQWRTVPAQTLTIIAYKTTVLLSGLACKTQQICSRPQFASPSTGIFEHVLGQHVRMAASPCSRAKLLHSDLTLHTYMNWNEHLSSHAGRHFPKLELRTADLSQAQVRRRKCTKVVQLHSPSLQLELVPGERLEPVLQLGFESSSQ